MANAPTLSLDQMLQESRQKRKAEELAQEIFGKKNRSRTPQGPRAKPAPGASLASRVGVAKRTNPLPRPNSVPAPRNARPPPPTQPNRPAQNFRTQSSFAQAPVEPAIDVKSNGDSWYDVPAPVAINGDDNISFRGAANTGPHTVIAQNFAPGTTAADIESVMADVGGQVLECKLLADSSTVVAELTFAEKSGAEAVVNTFNGKKADGQTLNVYLHTGATPKLDAFVDLDGAQDEVMEIDENAQAREAEDRLREERRGRNERPPPAREPPYPSGPRGGYPREDDYYGRGPRRPEPAYPDERYGYGGHGRYHGGRYHGGGGGGRMYSDGMGRRGQSWRP